MKSHTLTGTLIAVALLLPAAAPAGTFSITRTLSFASTGDDVRMLQMILARDATIYPQGLVTGFFGRLTRAAVQRFQVREGIVASGDEGSTGYGVVGPRTRAALGKAAGTMTSAEPPGDATGSDVDLLLPNDLSTLGQSLPVISLSNDTEEMSMLIEKLKAYVAELQVRVSQMSAPTVVLPPVADPVRSEDNTPPAKSGAQDGEREQPPEKQSGCWHDGKWYPEGARIYPDPRSRLAVPGYFLCINGKFVFKQAS